MHHNLKEFSSKELSIKFQDHNVLFRETFSVRKKRENLRNQSSTITCTHSNAHPQFHFNPINFTSHQIHNIFTMFQKKSLKFINRLEGFNILEKKKESVIEKNVVML